MTSATRKLTHPFMRTFDTHKYIKLLKSKGVKEPQAEVFVQAIWDANFANLATKEQVDNLEKRLEYLQKRLECLEQGQRWILGLIVVILTLIVTMLFKH